MTAPATDATAGLLTIDLGAVVENWKRLASMAPAAACAAVVKADAYGLGLGPVVGALAKAGCRSFFVARVAEAFAARAAVPDAAIHLLDGLPPGTAAVLRDARIHPVLGSVEEIAEWAQTGGDAPAALHVDTGMNRLGLPLEQAQQGPSAWPFVPALVMSHFVSSEIAADPLNALQMERFARVRGAFSGVPGSLANSSGIFLGPDAHHDMLRPGYALYGGNPTPGSENPMREVVQLEATVLQVRDVPAGATTGYNAQWTASRPSRLATIAYGYADGFPRTASSGGEHRGAEVVIDGRRCPIAGRISMDLSVVDITALPPGMVRRGDTATLLGDGIAIDEFAGWCGTNGYEILTRLGRRACRSYRGG